MNTALSPCPFCGGEAEIVNIEEGENAGGSYVCCTRCLASSNVEFEFKENFVSNWNRRSPAPAPAETEEDHALANFDKIKDSFFASNDAVLSASAKGVTDEMVEQALGEAGFPPTEFSRIWMGAALEAALALLPSESVETAGVVGWRSMDSAPKGDDRNGPDILVYGGTITFDSEEYATTHYSGEPVHCVSWYVHEKCWIVGRDEGHRNYIRLHNPAGWMPLPDAPASPSPATGEA